MSDVIRPDILPGQMAIADRVIGGLHRHVFSGTSIIPDTNHPAGQHEQHLLMPGMEVNAIVHDNEAKKADVILPAGASPEVDNEIPGMNKGRIEKALKKEGFETVSFYNIMDGSLGYRPDDSFFAGKDVSVSKLNNWELRNWPSRTCRRPSTGPVP